MGGELRRLPEQLISAQGSDLYVSSRVELRSGARLVFREEQVLGASASNPDPHQSSYPTARRTAAAGPQELSCGPGAPGGWDGPAGLGGHRALGQLVVVRPEFESEPPQARLLEEYAAVMPLAGPAVLVSALAPNALRLRRVLDEALRTLDR